MAYEAAFVLAPGWLVFRALSPDTRSLGWQLALGWPIGLVLEILGFSLTAALDLRDAFVLYPVLVCLAAGFVLRHRQAGAGDKGDQSPQLTLAGRWALAGCCLIAFAYVGIAYYAPTPLPGSAPGAYYSPDITFNLALAGEALHHWPVAEAKVVDGSYPGYHYFVNLHLAAVAQVTGIELPTILFRLYLLPLIALLVLQLGLVGSAITRLKWAGPVSAALLLLVQEVDLSILDGRPFLGLGAGLLWASPSLLLGLVLFVPAVFVLYRLIDAETEPSAGSGPMLSPRAYRLLLLILLIGCGGAKSVILPMLIGGLLLYLLWGLLRRHMLDRTALVALGLCAATQAAYLAVLYRNGAGSLHLEAGATFRQMAPISRFVGALPDSLPLEVTFWSLVVPIATAMFFGAPLLGLAWVLGRGRALWPGKVLLLAVFLAGLPAFFLLQHDGLSQLYFPLYGMVAVLPLAAEGLCRFFAALSRPPGLRWRLLAPALLAWVAALVALALWTEQIAIYGHPVRSDIAAYGLAAFVLGGTAIAAIRSRGPLRNGLAAFAVLGVLLAAALDTPLDTLPNSLRRIDRGDPLYVTGPIETRRAAIEGMEWMRDHLDEDAVLAVSNDRARQARASAPLDNTFPAFSEHRTFLEGWAYTARANAVGQADVIARREDPFPERRDLERAVFVHADRSALRELIGRYGVTHLVVDRKHGIASPGVYRMGRLVFSNRQLDVIELRPGAI